MACDTLRFEDTGLSVRQRLAMHKEICQYFSCHQMIESMVESSIAHGLHRESEFSDQELFEEVVTQTNENDNRLRVILREFVNREKLQLR